MTEIELLRASLRELLDWMPRVIPAAGQEDEWEAAVNRAAELLARHNAELTGRPR